MKLVSIWDAGVAQFQHRYPDLDGADLDTKAFEIYGLPAELQDTVHSYPVWDDEGNSLWVRSKENRACQKHTRSAYGELFRTNGYKPKAAPPIIAMHIRNYKTASGKSFTQRGVLSGAHRVESWSESKMSHPDNKFVVNMMSAGLHRYSFSRF